MSTLCETFRFQAFWTWQNLCLAHEIEVHMGEESFTDFNLLQIRAKHSDQVFTKAFTKFEESKVGADWEWWFTGRSGKWVGFRIQAKVIDHKFGRFEHLSYSVGARQSQVDKLCEHAVRNHCIPLYCLYTYSTAPFPTSRHAPESYGCSLLDAHYVRRHQRDSELRELKSLINRMLPWHCLVCHPHDGQDLPMRAHEVWRSSIAQPDILPDYHTALTDAPPEHVQLMLQNRLERAPDECLRSITVFSEGGEITWHPPE